MIAPQGTANAPADLWHLIQRHLGPIEVVTPVTYGRGWRFFDSDPAAAREILRSVVPADVDVESTRSGHVLVLDHRRST